MSSNDHLRMLSMSRPVEQRRPSWFVMKQMEGKRFFILVRAIQGRERGQPRFEARETVLTATAPTRHHDRRIAPKRATFPWLAAAAAPAAAANPQLPLTSPVRSFSLCYFRPLLPAAMNNSIQRNSRLTTILPDQTLPPQPFLLARLSQMSSLKGREECSRDV